MEKKNHNRLSVRDKKMHQSRSHCVTDKKEMSDINFRVTTGPLGG